MKTSPRLLLPLIALTALLCGHSFAAERKPLKVFILAGQSNMEGHAKIETFDNIAPKIPFVIGVIGGGWPTADYGPDQQRYKAT